MPDEVLSTYRVQFNPEFTFDDLAAAAPYLADLGITHVYCSPYLQAAEGSEHGYDVVEHPQLNSELGGREGFERMVDALDAAGLSHIVDIVPNHVSTEGNNRWWSVLKHGRDSRHAHWFDIDWDYLDGKVCAPLLGDTLEACLERGEITLDRSGAEPVLRYFDHVLPLAPDTDLEAPLEQILEAQDYWLVEWRRGNRNLNYRRFFDVNTLAAIQVQTDDVFESTHSLVLGLIAEGAVTGLRIDHIDGLHDPQGYLERLRERTDVPVWVEKILEPTEELPETWPVEGTTGYDFLNLVGGLFTDPAGEEGLTGAYAAYSGADLNLPELAYETKMLVMRQILIADIKRLVRQTETVVGPFESEDAEALMMSALVETIAAMDAYRTYVRPDGARTVQDERLLLDALESARRRARLVPAGYFEQIADVFLTGEGEDAGRALLMRFQQTSGPVMAKGLEDTLFYRFHRLVSLNEVGGDPGYFSVDVEEFHDAARRAAQQWPRSMLATSTHDTKRSEDVRARIAVLSEVPEAWAEAVDRWEALAQRHRIDGAPDHNTAYLLFQTLVGAHPLDADRACEYMLKAVREAKVMTSWLKPDAGFESALDGFIRNLLADNEFTTDLSAFTETLIEPGRINSLAQTLIKLTYPGVPDTYQGCELWALNLVDPDNRRPVDYAVRQSLLAHLDEADARQVWAFPDDGGPKLLVTTRALQLRRRLPKVFLEGSYTPLATEGDAADHCIAYLRGDDVAVVVPRLSVSLAGDWGDTTIPLAEGKWRNEITGERVYGGNVSLARLLDSFPVALLARG